MGEALQRMKESYQEDMRLHWEDGAECQFGGGKSSQLQPEVVYGYAALRNKRGNAMEDFIVADVREMNGYEVGIFGVFDAHQGPEVGIEVKNRLFHNILNEGGVWADPAGAIRDGYLLTDRQLLESAKFGQGGGCSAVTAMLLEHGGRLIVANLGDSRAVLCKNGEAVQVSVDHHPGRPVERASVEMRGGHVTTLPGDVARVDGQLALARAFGDKSLKQHLSAKPDLSDQVVDLSCEFLILGSNGLWSVVLNQEAVDVTKTTLDPEETAQKLVRLARTRLSDDDISCIVIRFQEK